MEDGGGDSAPSSAFDITFVTQTSFNFERLHPLNLICDRWKGPLSVVVFIKRTSFEEEEGLMFPTEAYMRDALPNCASPQHRHLGGVSVMVLQSLFPGPYPINRLRNLAILQVRTTHYFFADVDFIPSTNLRTTLLHFKADFLADPTLAVV